MQDHVEVCRYCGDIKRKPTWMHIGGTIGESHYVCHRKRCQKAHAASVERTRLYFKARREAKANG